jgi:hypothetical protein
MPKPIIHALARAFLAGEPSVEAIVERTSRMLGKSWRWLRPLAERYVAETAGRTRPHRRDVVEFLQREAGHRRRLRVKDWLTDPQRMLPVPAAAAWEVPAIESAGALAEWLGLTPGELDWFADLKGLGHKRGDVRLRHYHYRVLPKSDGGFRLIEAPKMRLKAIQRRILTEILEKVPPHPAVQGFVKRRSIKTFVAPHVGQRVVLKMDLEDFFPSFSAGRIQAIFRTMGYPDTVADGLAGICTNAAPRDIWPGRVPEIYRWPHLPQGAPASPALANIATYRADCRLIGLARSAGAAYTRYADDLAFSGDAEFDRRVERFAAHVAAILHEEGFAVNHHKTRIMRRSVRQRLAGLVGNERLNVPRDEFDRLKATLTNCVRHGPEGQNRDGHADFKAYLEGRVGFVESINLAKGRRLRALLKRIVWS